MKDKPLQAGFTLIELLIVIVILGLLMVVGLGSFTSSQMKSRDVRRKGDLQHIAQALEVYYNDKGVYPLSTSGTLSSGNPFVDPANPTATTYMNVLPEDPSEFAYYYDSDGTYFQLYARLENDQDGALFKDETDTVMVYTGTNCLIGACNYGLASTDTSPADGHTLVVEE